MRYFGRTIIRSWSAGRVLGVTALGRGPLAHGSYHRSPRIGNPI